MRRQASRSGPEWPPSMRHCSRSCRAGDRIVCTQAVYGSTRALLSHVFGRLGVDVAYVDPTDLPRSRRRSTYGRRRVLYMETISNPSIVVADIERLAELAHAARRQRRRRQHVRLARTCAGRSTLGADLVVESATKWLGGHSDVIAGVVAGSTPEIEAVRSVAHRHRWHRGALVSAFLVLRGIQTLHVRLDRHTETALTLARHLESRPEVRRVLHPGLPSHPQREVAQRLLRAGGGMLAVDLGSRERAATFIDAMRDPARDGHPRRASSPTPCIPPRRPTASSATRSCAAAGIPMGLVRISVGLEDAADLLNDVDAALDRVARSGVAA